MLRRLPESAISEADGIEAGDVDVAGVTLYGIDSVMAPLAVRQEAWERLARDIDIARLDAISHEIALSEVVALAPQLLEGQVRGRVVIDVNR